MIDRRVEKAEKFKKKDVDEDRERKEVVMKEKGEVEVFESVVVRLGRLRFRQMWLRREVSGSLTAAVVVACIGLGILVGFVGGWLMAGMKGTEMGEGVGIGEMMGEGRNWTELWQYDDQVDGGLGWSLGKEDLLSIIPSVS